MFGWHSTGNQRETALALAVQHHGAANLKQTGNPASKETVLTTADAFYDWLTQDEAEERDPR